MMMKHDHWKMRFPTEIRELEAQNGDKTHAPETARLHMPSNHCPPDTDACDQSATESLRSSPLKTIMPPTRMTQDKCVLKEQNDQAIQGSDSCLILHNRRGLHVCVSACKHTRKGRQFPSLLLTAWSAVDKQQHVMAC